MRGLKLHPQQQTKLAMDNQRFSRGQATGSDCKRCGQVAKKIACSTKAFKLPWQEDPHAASLSSTSSLMASSPRGRPSLLVTPL